MYILLGLIGIIISINSILILTKLELLLVVIKSLFSVILGIHYFIAILFPALLSKSSIYRALLGPIKGAPSPLYRAI